MNLVLIIIQFLLAVFLVLLYYKFVETRHIKKYSKENIPIDLKLFIQTQRVDVKKISYKRLMKLVAITNAVDIGIILVFTNVVSKIYMKFLISVPLIFIVLFASYRLVGFILKKKGMTLNES
ncbi:MAG: hypothetical protein Q4C29_01370 [bacterium]|nr:hypothetical protein [bacterium]